MNILRKISIEAWILLVIVLGDCVFTYILIETGKAVESSPLFFALGENLTLFFIVKLAITVFGIGLIEAIRLYPHKIRFLFVSLRQGQQQRLFLQPIWYLRITIALYLLLFLLGTLTQAKYGAWWVDLFRGLF